MVYSTLKALVKKRLTPLVRSSQVLTVMSNFILSLILSQGLGAQANDRVTNQNILTKSNLCCDEIFRTPELPRLNPLYQFLMRVQRIDPPNPLLKGEHEFKVPLLKGEHEFKVPLLKGEHEFKVPLLKGDLGGSSSMQLHIKFVLVSEYPPDHQLNQVGFPKKIFNDNELTGQLQLWLNKTLLIVKQSDLIKVILISGCLVFFLWMRKTNFQLDLNELKNTQAALRQSEERMRSLFNAIPDVIFRQRIDQTDLDFLSKPSDFIIQSEQLGESNLCDLPLNEEIKNQLREFFKKAIATGELQTCEYELTQNDQLYNYEARIVKSGVDEVICIVRDITKRKQVEESLRASQHFIKSITDAIPNLLYIYDLIEERNVYINRAIETVLGYTVEEIKKMETIFLPSLIHPEDINKVVGEHKKRFSTAKVGDIIEIEYRIKHKNNQWRWVSSRESIFSKTTTGEPKQIIGIIKDITIRKQTEEALQQANKKLILQVNELEDRNEEITLLSHMSDLLQTCLTCEEACKVIAQFITLLFPQNSGGIFMISNSRNIVEAINTWGTNLTTQTIFSTNECIALRRGQPHLFDEANSGLVCKHIHPDSFPSAYFCIPMMAQGEAIGTLYLSFQEPGQLTKTKKHLAVTVSRQISLALANLKLHETLQQQSIRDPLTGLFNRRYLEESLERELNRAERKQQSLGVIMLDVDHFKRFNDTFGHEAGDAVLRELGIFLQKHIRVSDIACRYGGEELTLILPEASLEDTMERAEKLRQGVKYLNVHYRRQPLGGITLSLGIAMFPQHGLTSESVIRAADVALYRAKAAGRDRVVTA